MLNNAKPYDVVLATYGLLVREEKTEITRRIELSDSEKAAYETMRMVAEADDMN